MKKVLYKALVEMRREYFMRRILAYYNNTNDLEIKALVDTIKKNNELNVFNYNFIDKYLNMDVEVRYDKNAEMYYVIENERYLYFKKGMKPEEIVEYYRGISMEQDKESPHRYLADDGIKLNDGDMVIDLGGAEGNFVFENIDKISRAIIVECDEGWVDALKMTFKDSPKVVIINKMISDKADAMTITIDDLVKKYDNGRIKFVKMDIEGMEVKALNGAKELINGGGVKWAVCTYHNQKDYDTIKSIFKQYGYKINHSKGFMTVHFARNFCKPYLRRGLIFGEKTQNN